MSASVIGAGVAVVLFVGIALRMRSVRAAKRRIENAGSGGGGSQRRRTY